MLVANEISKNQYVGDGSATEFAYTFPILDSTHIEVYRQLPTETALDAKLVPAEEYTVEGAGVESGGKVVFKTAPSSGTKLSILRNVPITQLYQYQELDSFPAESHENALAKLTMICQGLDERLDRAIVVSPTDTVTPDELRNNIFEASQEAQDSASAAKDSETAAAESESNAASSAGAAASSESSASSSATAAAESERNAASSAAAAAESERNAAESESNAAGSAAAILELKIEVTTLDPGLPATGNYDPVTGVLHLGIPKGDSGAAAIATPASLGSVMPQTGDEDGLELEEDGTLRVRAANATQRGGVILSPALDSDSEETSATSSAVKQLNDEKLDKAGGTLSGAIQEHLATLEGTSVTLDLTTSNNFVHTVTGATTFAVTAKDSDGFQLGTLVLTNGGAFPVTWPSSFKWADGAPPSLMESGIDVITFFTIDGGTTYYAAQAMTGIA